MSTPAYKGRYRRNTGIYIGPTRGLSSPRNSRRACLCLDSDTYDVKCCNGALMEQGIGQIQGTKVKVEQGAFSSGFSNGFDI